MVRHSAGATSIAGYCEVDRAHDNLDAPTPSVAPNIDAPQWSFAVDVRGLPVSLRGFLEDLHVQSLLSDHLLQRSVLFLQSFEFLGHLRLHATNLLPPAVIGLLGNLKLLADDHPPVFVPV